MLAVEAPVALVPAVPHDSCKPISGTMSAIIASPPAEVHALKSSRSMTHPLYEPKTMAAKRRVKLGEPFDPEELTRRLQVYLAEQKAKAERRREARAAKAAAAEQNGVYHHVPRAAATAFERTTTAALDVSRSVHKLAQPALKHHKENLLVDDALPGNQVTNLQRTQALDQAVLERDIARARNQFQWTHDMMEAAEVDIDREVYKPPQRTFNAGFEQRRVPQGRAIPRPLSTGEMFWEEDIVRSNPRPKPRPAHDANDRNDWAQRDQKDAETRRTVMERVGPFLRKKESRWILRGKEALARHSKSESVAAIGDFASSPISDGNKGGRASFLARFKRHPS